jgi:hypothetical protein
MRSIKEYWDYIQGLLDIDGDVIMFGFTVAVVYKILHGGLNASDAAAYASAVGCFAYSNRGPK